MKLVCALLLLPTLLFAGDMVGGSIIDSSTGLVIPHAVVTVQDSDASSKTSHDGHFHLHNIKPGSLLIVTAEGYQTVTISAEPKMTISMQSNDYRIDDLIVSTEAESRTLHSGDRVVELEGSKLREKLGSTIASTLDGESGVALRSMGPAPARPVIRGLDGNRLTILQDGNSTGDLSASSADHALVIDPMSAQGIDIIRGPAALMYGSNVLGGVINVRSVAIPDRRPNKIYTDATMITESASEAISGRLMIEGPAGPVVFKAEASARNSENINTPIGTLENTAGESRTASVGVAHLASWGEAGASFGNHTNNYGIPGGFLGGHTNGVDIELERQNASGRVDLHPEAEAVDHLELKFSWNRYQHKEIESSGICGVSFGLVTTSGSGRIRLSESDNFGKSTIGFSTEYRDYASGCLSFTPPTEEISSSVYGYNELEFGDIKVNSSLRYDNRTVSPKADISELRFSGISAGIKGSKPLSSCLDFNISFGKSFRAPALEELFSEGPHLAAYSYEVGNPDLKAENGIGIDAGLEFKNRNGNASISVFRNDYSNYIHSTNTGELEVGPGELGYLPLYQFKSQEALLTGVELNTTAYISDNFEIDGNCSYVKGDLQDSPLPLIPPLSGSITLRYDSDPFELTLTGRGSAEQDRLGEFEEPTDSYITSDASLAWHHAGAKYWHAVVLKIRNIGDVEYYNHLSRIKSIMPETGRNVSLLYRVTF
jgi:iron complex outermembrane recepter protein